jgi:hypothetical protein
MYSFHQEFGGKKISFTNVVPTILMKFMNVKISSSCMPKNNLNGGEEILIMSVHGNEPLDSIKGREFHD